MSSNNNNDIEEVEPTLQNIIDETSLKWIFVGGKGGVGKTTVSSCLAVLLAQHRESVLIISTDPAHNLSDAFAQQFTKEPTLVEGFNNLYAMEIDPSLSIEENTDAFIQDKGTFKKLMKDIGGSIPGIDEISSFMEIMKQIRNMNYSVVVFDTAPTGHTLRLLSFPTLLDKGVSKILGMGNISGMLQQVGSMFSNGNSNGDDMKNQIESTKKVIEDVEKQFKDPSLTTFVCVCIPEFLSVYETERLVQELTNFEIDTHNIVVNQLVFKPQDSTCKICSARTNIQKKYLDQISYLYEDFHVVKLPLLGQEVRGIAALKNFCQYLVKPYTQEDAERDFK